MISFTISSLALTALVLCITTAALPYLRRLYRRSLNPPNTGLEIFYLGASKTQRVKIDELSDAVQTKVDIIAVHGLGAHPTFTWSKGRRTEDQTLDNPQQCHVQPDRINWLKELLPRKFPEARVLGFAHNADWFLGAPQRTSQESAGDLLLYLKEKRKDLKEFRPIIFIAHSFGGILVKDAFITAKLRASRDPGAAEILKATCGIIFLGTPHQGAQLSNLATWLATLTGPILGSNSSLPRSIAYHSTQLDDKDQHFSQSYDNDTWLYSLYETMDTFLFGLNMGKIVNKSSASLRGGPRYEAIPIDKNHSELVKFNHIDDSALQKILMVIEELLEKSRLSLYFGENRQRAILDAAYPFRDSAINGLKLHQKRLDELTQQTYTQQSVDWFLSSSEYATWLSWDSPTSRFLWFRGKPHIGKSVTCVSIVNRLRDTYEIGRARDVVFFFCFAKCSTSDVIVSLLAQLVERDERRIHGLDSEKQDLLLAAFDPNCQHEAALLWDLFECIIRVACNRGIYIVIDGIDAIHPESDRKLFAIKLRNLWDAITLERSLQLKCLVTSLPYKIIRDALDCFNTVDPATELLECLNSLLPSAPNIRQNTVSATEEASGSWIFKEPQFRGWLRADGSSTLWLCGKPGSGKSTLIRKVMRGFQENLKSPELTVMLGGKQDVTQWTDSENNLNIAVGKKSLVGSFFYNSRAPQNKSETSHTQMLQSLLYQLLKQEEELFPIFRKGFVELRDWRPRHVVRGKSDQVRFDWPFETLLSILSSILNLRGRSCVLYIFIDAMDESDAADRGSVLSLLTHTDAVEVKTMITSRPLGPQKPIVGYEIILEQHNSKDIVRIVESKVSLFMGLTPQTEIPNYNFRLFQEKVIDLADGVILWVSLVLSMTQSLFEDGPPPSDEMMQTLENLPDDMERLYIGIVDHLKLKPANVEKGKQWLKWATFSARLLDLDEFRDAIAVSELGSKYNGNPTTLRPKQIGSSFKTAESNLRRICGGFVELRSLGFSSTALQSVQPDELASSTAIQLLHQTVKLFLQKEKASPFNSFKPEGDLLIAKSCSRYLLSLSEGSFVHLVGLKQATTWDMEDYECFVHHIESLPLLNYVFTFLPYHLISQRDLDDLEQIINIVGTNQLARYLIASWASQILLDCKQRPNKQRITILDPKRWPQFWSHQPSIRLSERETLFMPKFITTALVAAVKARSFIAVKALVAVGAAVDTTSDLNASSALDVAATEGQLDIYAYLALYATDVPIPTDSRLIDSSLDSQPLANKTDSLVTGVGSSTNIALHVAAGDGNVSQVRWLLDAGAQPDSRDDQNRSAVHIAALLGHAESINLLLDAGADVDSKDNLGRTPLMLVAENGHVDAARVLLDHNADLELKSNSGATPYSLARLHKHKVIIQLLYGDQEPNAANSEQLSTFLVPFSRSRYFVGRESILENITHLVKWQVDQPIALVGLGGVGKSQVALEYVYRVVDQYPALSVFWASAQNKARLEQSFNDIAKAAKVPNQDKVGCDIVRLVFEWLSNTSSHWLLVIDSLDDAEVLYYLPVRARQEIPNVRGGQIIITTRDRRIALLLSRPSNTITLEPLSLGESMELLQQSLGYKEEEEPIHTLVTALDFFPLAITQAAAFISQSSITASKYLELFNEGLSGSSLLKMEMDDLRRDPLMPNSIFGTFAISFHQIRRQNAKALDLLYLMSLLDRQDIPEYLISPLSENHSSFIKAIRILIAYSLVANSEIHHVNHYFTMHRLIQLAARKLLEDEGNLTAWIEKSVERVYEVFPQAIFENWKICAELLPHAYVVLEYRLRDPYRQIQQAQILHRVGEYEMTQGRYGSAENSIVGAFTIRSKILGQKDPSTLDSMNSIAYVLRSQGKYTEAEAMQQQVLQLREKILGKEHPDTLTSMDNLAKVLKSQGKYQEAEAMQRQVLQLREKILGKEHPDTLTSMDSLAQVFESQEKYQKAELMHRQALQLIDKALGKDHPNTLTSMNNLAVALKSQGKYQTAEVMHRQALQLRENILGKEHPNTLTSMDNLAQVFKSQGKYQEAEAMQRQVLQLREKILGKEHPDTLTSMDSLAQVFESQEKYQEAEAMQQQALQLMDKVLD
ncbi:hypothetical protein VF21_10112 [Pseudogymnoascus sp. 05NY08]|nr:hypothetical protein VF21_10112 [Pseudogymnoascus sp. 05NY08]